MNSVPSVANPVDTETDSDPELASPLTFSDDLLPTAHWAEGPSPASVPIG
ncbi:MAG: hypothetical protein ACOX52_11775 [Verrucomicrobiota bacterium]